MNKYIISILALTLCSCAPTTPTPVSQNTTSTTIQSVATAIDQSPYTQFAVEAAGTGSAVAIILYANPKDKASTANDILTIDAALLTLLDGTVPTVDQMQAVAVSFKSDSSTTNYIQEAQGITSNFGALIKVWQNSGATASQITKYATWYIYGLQLGAKATPTK